MIINKLSNRIIKEENGAVIVFVALAFAVICSASAIAVDAGFLYLAKTELQDAVDAAALAGAQELISNKVNAINVANQYLVNNDTDPDGAEVEVSDGDTRIRVSAQREVNFHFAKLFGLDKGDVAAQATARYAPVSGVYEGIRPFAVEEQTLVFGQTYILKEGGGAGSNGNYGAVALGGNGANNYEDKIINGYDGHLKVGDYINTEPGNMSGPTMRGITALIDQCDHSPECTFDNYDPDCPKIITIIIVDSLDVHGRDQVKITGFASFFLEGVSGMGNESIVTGKFIERISDGDIDDSQTDFGLRGIQLVN